MATLLYTTRVLAGDVNPARTVLTPFSEKDLETLVRVKSPSLAPSGQPLPWHTVITGQPRSRQEEAWYRGLVGVVAEGIGMEPNTLHFQLKFHAGKIIEMVRSPELGLQLVLKSSRDMDHEEYHTFVVLAVEILFQRYLPGARRGDVYKEVERRVGHGPS